MRHENAYRSNAVGIVLLCGVAMALCRPVAAADPAARTPEQEIRYAHWLVESAAQKALDRFDAYLAADPQPDLAPWARYGRGRALFALGRLQEAFEAVQESFPEKRPAPDRLAARCGLEVRIAHAFAARAADPDKDGDRKNAAALAAASRVFEAVVYNNPDGPYVAEALLGLGDVELARARPGRAAQAYLRLVEVGEDKALADLARARAALALARAHRADEAPVDAPLDRAAELLDSLDESPGAPPADVRAARRALAEARARDRLDRALFYLRTPGRRSQNAAVYLLRSVVENHPRTDAAAEARGHLESLKQDAGPPAP